ncbi:MAG: hypothetical protein WEA28_08750 [Xanthobacteraceae bacterium]
MLSSIHVLPGVDLVTGAFALSVFVAGAAVAVLVVLGVVAFRRAGEVGTSGALWRGALVLVGAVLAWALLDRSSIREEFAAERRAIETRAAELTARAIEPGSALACLDAVAGVAVETACEKPLFASPEAVAAAVAYVDARLSLLIASVRLAERDPSYRPSLERLWRAIEADRFGLVAHVLMTRGCNGGDCVDLKLLRSTGRILANMKARAFDTRVNAHAAAWHPAGAAVVAAAPAPALAAMPPLAAPAAATGAAASVSSPSKFEFPSAASIPPVSIMNAEPEGPPPAAGPAAEPRAAAPPPKRAPTQPARRQSAREPASQPSPPLSVVPQAASPSWPQITGSR